MAITKYPDEYAELTTLHDDDIALVHEWLSASSSYETHHFKLSTLKAFMQSGGQAVSFVADAVSLPPTGTTDALYIVKQDNTLHRWDGAGYVMVGGQDWALPDMGAWFANSFYVVPNPSGWQTGDPIAIDVFQDTNFSANRFVTLALPSNGLYTISLPYGADIQAGDKLVMLPQGLDASTYNLTIDPSIGAVNGNNTDIVVDIKNLALTLQVFDPAKGWVITGHFING